MALTRTDKSRWIEKLREAKNQGLVYQVTDSYIKLHRWSLTRYFNDISAKRVRAITNTIRLKQVLLKNQNAARNKAWRKKQEALDSALSNGLATLGS